ncbi:MAG: PQQ-binding-like beta-propeller repeat protein [Planctomycetaceae bacterium]
MFKVRQLVLPLALIAFATAVASAENWPGWRGPRGDGSSTEASLPLKWSATRNIVWKVPIQYGGHSSPVVWGDRVILVGADTKNKRRMLQLLDRKTGKTLWERAVLRSPLEGKHKLNSWASGTPATDGRRIYVSFLDRTKMFVAAYDFDGKKLWAVRPGVFSSKHGYCSSPVLYKDKVIVNGDHDGDAYIVALDRKTGKQHWRIERTNKTRSYCTPIIRTIHGRTQMILSGSKCVASYDPDTGKRHWILDGPTEQYVASLVMNKGLIFMTGGFPDKHMLAIDPSGRGNITDSRYVKWHHRRVGVSYVPSPVAAGDYFLVVSDSGIGSCFDAASGKRLWKRRMGRRFSASLTAAGKRVYFLDDDGNCTVVRAGPKYSVIAKNSLGEATYASPALSNGRIFIRGEEHLFCISAQ